MKQRILHSFRLRAVMLVAMLCAAVTGAWAEEVTDELTRTWTGVTGTEYTAWSNKELTSNAVYAGQSAGGNSSIQLRSNNNNSGVVTTTSGGKVKSITVEWNSSTSNGRTLNVYGKNSAYSAASDLYNASNQGTLLGTIVKGTSTSLTISGDYEYIGFRSASGAMYLTSVSIVWETGGGSGSSAVATTTTIDATGITNTDVYTSTAAGTLAATVTAGGNAVDGATVTWSGNNDNVATIDEETGEVTLVAAGSVTFTATYAGVAGTYQPSSATYDMTVTNSTPYVQPTTVEITPNYTFWGKTAQFSGNTYSDLSGSKDNVTLSWTRGSGSTYASTTAMRFYKDNTLTFTAPSGYEIKSIQLAMTQSQSDLSFSSGSYSSSTWTGSSQTVTMSRPSNASSYAQITTFTITLAAESTDPSITASDVNIEYDATGGSITFTLKNEVTGGLISASTTADWLTLGNETSSPISFTCSANGTTERTATVTLTYTYNTSETVTKNVTITQAAAPVIYTTIPALFDAATSTETDVNVTFGGWVVSAVNGSNAYLTDNQGHGLIIYKSGHGFQVNDVLTGTVNCKLKLYNGSAEFTNLTTSTEGLTVTSGGTVTAQTIAISELSGVNTGALLSFEGLTYNGTALVDGNSNTITPYTTLYSGTFESGKSYDVTGIYAQYNDTKEILPRSAADIEEVQIQHQDYDLTVTLGDNVSAIYVFDAADQSNPLIADGAAGTVQVADATQVLVSPDVASGYALGFLTVDGVDVTEEMNEGSYSFTMPTHAVTITATAVPVKTYTLASTITSGKHYIIANGTSDDVSVMGTQNTNNRAAVEGSVDGTTLSVSSNAEAVEFVIYGPDANNHYTIYDGNGYLYAASSSSNYLKTQTTNDDNGRWSISFGEGGVASIVAQGSNTRNVMQYNSSNKLFACYSSASQKPVYLYEKDGEATPTESKTLNGYGYATYASQNALDFTNATDVTAWTITGINGNEITFSQIEGSAPAGTGLFLKGEASGSVTMTSATGASALTGNLLEGIIADKTITDGQYFGLKGKEFVPVNAGTIPAGKALLPENVIPASSGVKAFTFVFVNTATGVRTVETVSAEDAKAIFNLAGQRLSKTQRGINIVNGKKVVVK